MPGTLVGLCEDDNELRSVLVRSLEAEEYEVVSARTGHEAPVLFLTARDDVVVPGAAGGRFELRMPGRKAT